MKLKRNLFCIVDKNNKPDYRFLFECPEDAQRKIKQIKNSIKGETLMLGLNQRDFFDGKISKDFISPKKKVTIKRGCWTPLQVRKISLMEDFKAEKLFKKIVKAKSNELCYTRQREREAAYYNPALKIPVIPNPFLAFNWESSFLKTKAFMASFAFLCITTVGSVVFIQQNTTDLVAQTLINEQAKAFQRTAQMQTQVLGKKDEKLSQQFDNELDKFVVETLKRFDSLRQEELEGEVRKMVTGTPMEQMVPYIAQRDRTVVAFLVGIAKKESNFGRRVPVLNGQDCYNYWGYRGIRERMGSGGHTCFDSPEDAVNTVAGRLQELVQADIDTPQEMVIWKCGSTCAGHSSYSVRKWISDVDMYFSEIENPEQAS